MSVIKNMMYEHLTEYYKFLSCFDVTAFIDNKNDYQILYNFDDEKYHTNVESSDCSNFSIQDEYKALYSSLKNKNTAIQEHVNQEYIMSNVSDMNELYCNIIYFCSQLQ